LRLEGINMDKVHRLRYEPVQGQRQRVPLGKSVSWVSRWLPVL